jgi:hypothetical protein
MSIGDSTGTIEWRPVPDYEQQYEVSNTGYIRRIGRGYASRPGRLVKAGKHPCGYRVVSLWKHNRGRSFLVHRIVAAVFLGPIPEDEQVNHKDGDKTNNAVSNLEYVTRSGNVRHAMANRLMKLRGAENPNALLDEDKVILIRFLSGFGMGYKRISRLLGLTWGLVRSVVTGQTWAHLPGARQPVKKGTRYGQKKAGRSA